MMRLREQLGRRRGKGERTLMTHEAFREMLPLYVVGALDGDELHNFERYLAENRERCIAELAEYQAVADQIALAAPSARPSPTVYDRIAAAIDEGKRPAAAPAATPVASPARAREAAGRFNLGALIVRLIPWAAAAVLAVVVMNLNTQTSDRDAPASGDDGFVQQSSRQG